jgi:hypothetical protein
MEIGMKTYYLVLVDGKSTGDIHETFDGAKRHASTKVGRSDIGEVLVVQVLGRVIIEPYWDASDAAEAPDLEIESVPGRAGAEIAIEHDIEEVAPQALPEPKIIDARDYAADVDFAVIGTRVSIGIRWVNPSLPERCWRLACYGDMEIVNNPELPPEPTGRKINLFQPNSLRGRYLVDFGPGGEREARNYCGKMRKLVAKLNKKYRKNDLDYPENTLAKMGK